MSMGVVATWAFYADHIDALQAARLMIECTGTGSRLLAQLLDAALWRDEDLEVYEQEAKPTACEGRWGKFWISPEQYWPFLPDDHPRICPRGLARLARGVVDVLTGMSEIEEVLR